MVAKAKTVKPISISSASRIDVTASRYYGNLNIYFLERIGTHAVTLSVLVTKGHRFFVNTYYIVL